MAFTANKDYANMNSLKPEGSYETIITETSIKTAQTGTKYINIALTIRNDVNQKYQNGIIWHKIFEKLNPEPEDMEVEGFTRGYIEAFTEAIPELNKRNYKSVKHYIGELLYKPVKVNLIHKADRDGKIREEIRKLEVTAFPEVKHAMKAKTTESPTGYAQSNTSFANASADVPTDNENETDDDYPF